MIGAIGRSESEFNRGHCLACFDQDYPTELTEEAKSRC
jgi:amidophosphoribosyltransferase